MKKLLVGCVGLGLALVGCAADSQSEPATPEIGTAYYALTLMDCHEQATACVQRNLALDWGQRPERCLSQLAECKNDVAFAAADTVLAGAEQLSDCGFASHSCLADAKSVEEAYACQQAFEQCGTQTVYDLTGIDLPTSGEVVAEVAAVGEQVKDEVTAHVQEAVDHAQEAVDQKVDAVDQAVDGAIDAADAFVDALRAADACADASRDCLRSTGDLFGCGSDYFACMSQI